MFKKRSTYHPFRLSPANCFVVLCGIVLLTITSCKRNLNNGQPVDDKMVVLAEITAGDSMKIPVGKTIKVGGGGIIRFEKVPDASVTISDLNNHSWMLQPSWSPQYASNPTTVYTSRIRFKSNYSYVLTVKHPTLGVVNATTYIPSLPIITEMDTMPGAYQGKDVLTVNLSWRDGLDKDEYYIIEVLKQVVKVEHYYYFHGSKYNYDTQAGLAFYNQVKDNPGVHLLRDTIPQNDFLRVNVYTSDLNSDNAGIDVLSNPFHRIFYKDYSFNGLTYSTKFYIDRQMFVSSDPTQQGRIRIQFKSASKELYEYLLAYEKYKTDFGSVPTGQLVSPSGNILNGLGIFGGSARRERIYYFDNLW